MSVEMTPEEQSAADELLAGLHAAGYQDLAEWRELKPGVRIRHRGHQYPEAYERGTGVVVAVTEKPDSSWSKTYGAADIEMVVLNDERPQALGARRVSTLAQYHVAVVGDAS